MSSSSDSFHCSEEEVLQVGLKDREVGAGQGGGWGRTVAKILSGCLSAIEHIRRLEDLNIVSEHVKCMALAEAEAAGSGQLGVTCQQVAQRGT